MWHIFQYRLIGQLGEDHAAEAELIQFAADSKDIDILKERLVQINSFGLRNIEEPRLFIDMDWKKRIFR